MKTNYEETLEQVPVVGWKPPPPAKWDTKLRMKFAPTPVLLRMRGSQVRVENDKGRVLMDWHEPQG